MTTFIAPPGISSPSGWKVKPGSVGSYKYRNPDAPGGATPIRGARIKEGKKLKIVARQTGLALTGAQGRVAIRVIAGQQGSCALFSPSTALILRDEADRFQAKNATTSGFTDCSAASLGLP
jgi:hypothetical protein